MTIEIDIPKLHEGTDGPYYKDYITPDKSETFIGRPVSTERWHKGVRFVLICSFQTVDGRRIALFAFQKHTGFYGPKDGAANFKHMEKNILWECEIRKTRTERCARVSARQVVEPKIDAI